MSTVDTPPTRQHPKQKFSIALAAEMSTALEALAKQRAISMAEAIRRGISLELFLEPALAAGKTIVLRAEDGTEEIIRPIW